VVAVGIVELALIHEGVVVGVTDPPAGGDFDYPRRAALGPLPRVAMMAILISRAGTCTVAFRYDTASFAAADQLEKCLQAGFDEIVELGRRTS